MKTKCYCIFCKKHPLHDKQKEFKDWLTGWDVGNFIDSKYNETCAEVNCLNPDSDAFDELDLTPSNLRFPITAYGDGFAVTGFEGNGFTIYASCKNEDYKEL